MAIVCKFGSMSKFEPGENVLHCVPSVGFISTKALPTYQLFFPFPLLLKASLYITDRRVFLVVFIFGRVFQQFSMWYPKKAQEGDQEIVKSTSMGNLRILGPYLEVVSHNSNRPWYHRYLCSSRIRHRFYMKNPEPLYESICNCLKICEKRK